jgi:hypothetical protein
LFVLSKTVNGNPGGGFVLAGLGNACLARTDAQQDSQNLQIGHALRERGIQTRAALLDQRKIESRREGNRLEQIRVIASC